MITYYQAPSSACVDGSLADFRQNPQADTSTLVGFLAQLFRTSPQERKRVLAAETTDRLKDVDLVSLYRADLTDEAAAFAQTGNLSAYADKVRAAHLPTLDDTRPSAPSDNDLLIGAFMASGDVTFIRRVLAPYSDANDGMVSDAMRIGLMLGRFGKELAPKGRNAVTWQAACEKYQCKSDRAQLVHLLTLATALWSLRSLSEHDDRIRSTFADFFSNQRLKRLFDEEQKAFANYLTMVNDPAGPDSAALNRAAEMYEKLLPANELGTNR